MGDHCWSVNIGVTMKNWVLISVIISLGLAAAQEGDVSKEFLNNWITKIHERYNPDLVKGSKEQGKRLTQQATTYAPPVTTPYAPPVKPAPAFKAAPYKPAVKPYKAYPRPTYKPVVFKTPSYPKPAPKPAPYTPPTYPKPSPKPIAYAPVSYHKPTYKPVVYKPTKPVAYSPPAYQKVTPPVVYHTPVHTVAPYKPPAYKPAPKSYPKPSYSKPKVVFEKPSHYKPVYAPSNKHEVYAQDYAYDGKATYKYEYAVVDEYAGLDFGANEGRDGYVTQGEYRVLLPDCRTQVVRYNTADAYSGNVAEVTYEGTPCYNDYKKHS